MVRCLRARGDEATVRAVTNDGERGLIGARRGRVGQLAKHFPSRNIPQLDAALSACDRERPTVRAEVDSLPSALGRPEGRSDRAPCGRIPERRPTKGHGRQELAVRTERRGVDRSIEPLEPRPDPRTVLECAQERTARIARIVEAARLEREEERDVRMLPCRLPRQSSESPGLRDARFVLRIRALEESGQVVVSRGTDEYVS